MLYLKYSKNVSVSNIIHNIDNPSGDYLQGTVNYKKQGINRAGATYWHTVTEKKTKSERKSSFH